jgi:MFS family permease
MPPASSSEAQAEPPLFSRDLALIIAIQLAFGFAFSSFYLLPKYVVTRLGGSPSQVGYVGACSMVAAVAVSPLCGWLLDRGPRRPLIVAGSALSVLSSLAFLVVHELGPLLYAVRAAQGISFTFFFVSAGTLVADVSPPARLGQALGWFGSASLLMNAVATLFAERIAHDFGWQSVFGVAACCGLLASVLALFLREPERRPRPRALPSPALESALEGRGAILWATAAGGAAFGVMFTFAQPFALSLGDTNVSPLFAGYTASALLVRLVFGNLPDRLGRARVGGAALALYALVVATTAGLAPGLLGFVGLGCGLAHGAFYPALNALALQGAERGQRGAISGYFNAAFNGGALLVTFTCGQVAQAYGYRTVFLLVAAVTGSGALLLLRDTRRKSLLARLGAGQRPTTEPL